MSSSEHKVRSEIQEIRSEIHEMSPEIKISKETTESPIRTLNDAKLTEVIHKALQSPLPLLQKAFKQEQAFRAQTELELHDIFTQARKLLTEHNQDTDPKNVKKRVLEQLQTDFELISRMNTVMASYSPKDTQPKDYGKGDAQTCTYPLKFNKMAEIIPTAQAFVTAHFEDVFYHGKLPPGYHYHSNPRDITFIGKNPISIYGDSKGSFLKTAALTTLLIVSGKACFQDLFSNLLPLSIDQSALVHVTHLPLTVHLSQHDPRFDKFIYSFKDVKMHQGLVFVHSGYAYGGHRDTASRYSEGQGTKAFGPEDCSSWIAKLSHSALQFSTLDQIFSYRLKVLQDFHISLGIVPEDYKTSEIATTMLDLFEPVIIKDPQKDIRPGQIYAHRSFDRDIDPTMQGPGTKGGHTGLVLDFISDGKDSRLAMMAYARNMPGEEGFGVQTFPLNCDNRKVMLFSLKSKFAPESEVPKGEGYTQRISSCERRP